jgi:hypothetical protein
VRDRGGETGALDPEDGLELPGERPAGGVLAHRRGAHGERLAESRHDSVDLVEGRVGGDDHRRRDGQAELDETCEPHGLASGPLEGDGAQVDDHQEGSSHQRSRRSTALSTCARVSRTESPYGAPATTGCGRGSSSARIVSPCATTKT